MKKIIIVSLCSLVIALSSMAQEQVQKETCENVKNGTYRLKPKLFNLFGDNYIVQREDGKQIEADSFGDKFIFDVEWLTDCSYELTLQQIINNSEQIEFSDQPILVEITEVTTKGYKNKVTMNIDGSTLVRTNTMIKESPNQHKELQKLLHSNVD